MVNAGLWFSGHLGDRSEEPIRGPALPAVHAVGNAAGPASETGELPATDKCVQNSIGVVRQCAAFADWDIRNPVEVDLMGEVIVGDGAGQVRGKGVCQAASDQ